MIKNDKEIVHIDDMQIFDSDDLEILLHKILSYLKKITNADAGTIYLKNGDSLDFTIFQNDSFSYEKIFQLQKPLKGLKLSLDDKDVIAVESFYSSKIILVDDIYKDEKYGFDSSKKFDKEYKYKTKSILTAPLINRYEKDTIGVVQLINKKDNDNNPIAFSNEDKEFISLSSYLIVLSIMNAKNNIEELKKANLELEEKVKERTKKLLDVQNDLIEQSNRDPMTNLYNRRYFNEIIDNIFSISKRGNNPLTILMVDIDNFKIINDTYGHHKGDLVINKLASIFKNICRSSDIAIRFGGEEFVILLTNTDVLNGSIFAEKLLNNVRYTTLTTDNKEKISFTISIGLSKVERDDKDIDVVLHNADVALYEAKKSGKDKQVTYKGNLKSSLK